MTDTNPFASIVGQQVAVSRLMEASREPVHAYLFVGPRGAGKRRAAAVFAGELVGQPDDRERVRRLAALEQHPDLLIFEPEGTSFRREEAEKVIIETSRAPVEGASKVIVIDRFHEATAEAAAKLLKPIEEPPASTHFVLLTAEIPPEHITIASRSTQIDFPAVSVHAIEASLLEQGIDAAIASTAAQASGGDVNRATLLITDAAFAQRRHLWWEAPTRLDGSGAAVGALVAELRTMVDAAQDPLDERHASEAEAMSEAEELTGLRGSGRSTMEARQRRETRLHRTDEWRMGLATLAHRYREGLVEAPDQAARLTAFKMLDDASVSLGRNPNEELWLADLLLRLPSVR